MQKKNLIFWIPTSSRQKSVHQPMIFFLKKKLVKNGIFSAKMAFSEKKMAFSAKKWHFSVKKWQFQWKSTFLGGKNSLRRQFFLFFFVGGWPKTGIFRPNRQKKAGWNRKFSTKKQEQLEKFLTLFSWENDGWPAQFERFRSTQNAVLSKPKKKRTP